jgi:hypothetical protein
MPSRSASLRSATSRAVPWYVLALMALALTAPACGGDDDGGAPEASGAPTTEVMQTNADPGDCSAEVDHTFVPLAKVTSKVFEGTEEGDEGEQVQTRVVLRVRDEPAEIAGFPVRVAEVRESEDGELVEQTLDYYSQCGDGSVWYVGEKVDDLEGGKVVGHGGQWQAGKGGAEAGLFMPVEPEAGDTFEQERAPGVAEDRSKVVAVDQKVEVPAGAFDGCIKTEDYAPLDKITEFKFYCPNVGLVREEGEGFSSELVRYS